jgi:hypothetical protein
MEMAVMLPGWNSIESVTRWHRGFEIAGFIALGLLLLFEVLTYVYGNRKDALIAAKPQLTPAEWSKQQEANERALGDLQTKLGAAKQQSEQTAHQLEESQQKLSQLEKQAASRELTRDQLSGLNAALSVNPKYAVEIDTPMGDQEAARYAKQFETVLRDNGWTIDGPNYSIFNPPLRDIQITVGDPRHIPTGAIVLANALKQAGIVFTPTHATGVTSGAIQLRIGTKP